MISFRKLDPEDFYIVLIPNRKILIYDNFIVNEDFYVYWAYCKALIANTDSHFNFLLF